jgi:hypothetical protein
MGFPAHPNFIGRDAPKRYVELGSCAFRVNLNTLIRLNIVILSEAKNPATSSKSRVMWHHQSSVGVPN